MAIQSPLAFTLNPKYVLGKISDLSECADHAVNRPRSCSQFLRRYFQPDTKKRQRLQRLQPAPILTSRYISGARNVIPPSHITFSPTRRRLATCCYVSFPLLKFQDNGVTTLMALPSDIFSPAMQRRANPHSDGVFLRFRS